MSATTEEFQAITSGELSTPADIMTFFTRQQLARKQRLETLNSAWSNLKDDQNLPGLRYIAKELSAGLQVDLLLNRIAKDAVTHLRTDVFLTKQRNQEDGGAQINDIIDDFFDHIATGTKIPQIKGCTSKLEQLAALDDAALIGNAASFGKLPDLKLAIGEAIAHMNYMPPMLYTEEFTKMTGEIGQIEDQLSCEAEIILPSDGDSAPSSSTKALPRP